MGKYRGIKKFAPLLAILLVMAIAAGIFLYRSPVLIVTDSSFEKLYGPLRLTLKGVASSLSLFRRVVPVPVAESAGPDLVALAAGGASASPLAVLFPQRYLEGARLYKKTHQNTPVVIMEGKNAKTRDDAEFSYISTDTAQDLYRAGSCAALFARDAKVLFFYDGTLKNDDRDAFREGLRSQGYGNEPVYLNASTDYPSYSGIGCVIIAGQAVKFLERNLKIPVLLFSWADPAIAPSAVKLIFDDSPWALATEAVRVLPKPGEGQPGEGQPGEELRIPSVPVLVLRSEEKKDFRIMSSLIKAKFQKK